MIGQYLLNTNEIGIVHILQNFLELNKAHVMRMSASCSISEFRLSVNSVHGFLFVLPSLFQNSDSIFFVGFQYS